MNKKELRMSAVVELLREEETLPVTEIAERLGVSVMTVRRDLTQLEQRSIIRRTHGKASYNTGDAAFDADHFYDLALETGRRDAEKERIGRYAASLIVRDDILILDSGTTVAALAKYIPDGLDLNVLCYNLNIMNLLSRKSDIRIIMAGGYFHPHNQMFESTEGINLIRSLRATKLFISAVGVHEQLGMTTPLSYEVPVKQAILQSSQTRILLADSSKFGTVRAAFFAQMEEVDMIITDSGLPDAWQEIIREKGIDLHIV